MLQLLVYVAIGLVAGIASGLVGIGGGVLITPALVLLVGFTQQQAQGTTLALMVPPIGLLAAWEYYHKGLVDLKVAGLICLGFFIGGFFGAKFATGLSNTVLEKIFGVTLLVIGLKMLFLSK
jgi:uncharacterized membrane protein YfcA